ncbi:MAG TPA: hemerythrin domain-containing protein [Bacillota bacterium]|nr:hemerythrin domain-containing protein [Bacillota bacterium]
MSGPSLKQLHAHHSIHEGAFSEGNELFEILCKLYQDNRLEHSRMVAEALIEHWETRTLAHAEAEEEGFYLEKASMSPELAEKVLMLRRDHDLMRILVGEIKDILSNHPVNEDVIDRFKMLFFIVRVHSTEEEKSLF